MNSRSTLVGVLDNLMLTMAALLVLALLTALVSPPAAESRGADARVQQSQAALVERTATHLH
jgi:hypothetical protein